MPRIYFYRRIFCYFVVTRIFFLLVYTTSYHLFRKNERYAYSTGHRHTFRDNRHDLRRNNRRFRCQTVRRVIVQCQNYKNYFRFFVLPIFFFRWRWTPPPPQWLFIIRLYRKNAILCFSTSSTITNIRATICARRGTFFPNYTAHYFRVVLQTNLSRLKDKYFIIAIA